MLVNEIPSQGENSNAMCDIAPSVNPSETLSLQWSWAELLPGRIDPWSIPSFASIWVVDFSKHSQMSGFWLIGGRVLQTLELKWWGGCGWYNRKPLIPSKEARLCNVVDSVMGGVHVIIKADSGLNTQDIPMCSTECYYRSRNLRCSCSHKMMLVYCSICFILYINIL